MTHGPSGAREVVVYNWPLYAAGAACAVAGAAAARRLPGAPRAAARGGALLAAGWLLSSVAASWWVYDRSGLHAYTWLPDLLPDGPGDHLVVSGGLDEASLPLSAHGRQTVADLGLATTGSLRRARDRVPPSPRAVAARPDRLPVESASQDTVFLVFAAHELRRPRDRESLFAECARALRPGGALILVEHLRDAANAAVYGPGSFHFFPRAEWLRVAGRAGLRTSAERRIGTFVTAFAFLRDPA
ncbi:class I SAM-dependent methyltransferase [Planotetraspora sp. A-T 1434]|uniref:class I SAM-dependent methyltransferase n=1 Tax=Planotetraspora sp. A-T 1434 TaxID=2979219 RepID=UPI0021BF4E9E|nr:class I SAM-dependent methyltransferase [Planotetraspora sp. A-T 1434]MCT9930771.1 class I SAM-dependent methyltransferase [Planotetraspora sp. A-T 1434]